ncbi:MAG: hypothetical protein M3R59_03435 [Verrucomicrobiota bacterium]|nr:hypothetical protein [Verrucomicrobiota bacterium]
MKITLTSIALAALLSGCASTQQSTTTTTTTKKSTTANQSKVANRIAMANNDEPAPPAEGPQDAPPGPGRDPMRNPGLVPTPLLRDSAASDTP